MDRFMKIKKRFKIKKELEFEVDSIDQHEAEEILTQFIELGVGQGLEVMDISFRLQKTISIDQI